MALFEKYYSKIALQKANFERMLKTIEETQSIDTKLELAQYALSYAVFACTGYFSSSVLETVFTDYAKSLKVDLSKINYKANSFLHVLTEGFHSGGHTRVVERWIENAPKSQLHSVCIIKPNDSNLNTLKSNVKDKKGEFITFDNALTLKERALKLRLLAMKYEYVILHTHMDDATATVAFGTEDFKRPVLFYNHASHLFWIGKAVSDLHLDLIENDEITQKRKIHHSYFLGIPSKHIELSNTENSIFKAPPPLSNLSRQYLNKKIIICAGHRNKFKPIDNENLFELIKKISDENTVCFIIGISPKDSLWAKVQKQSDERIIPLGVIEFDKGYMDYIKMADLYLDSYPFPGGTALIDAISLGVPVLSLKTALPQLDYLTKTSAYCHSKDEFIAKAKKILNDKAFAKSIVQEVQESLIKYQSIKVWNEKMQKLLKVAPKIHKVKDLTKEVDLCKIDDLCVINNIMLNEQFMTNQVITEFDLKYGFVYKKFGFDLLISLEKRRKNNIKTLIIKCFNKPLLKYSRNLKPS